MRFTVSSTVGEIETAYTESGDVVEALAKEGLYLPPRPQDTDGKALDPLLPPDLSVLELDELAKIHTEFTHYSDYAQGRLALAITDKAVRQGIRDAVWAKLRSVKTGQPGDKDDATRVDPMYLKADSEAIRATCKVSLIEAVMSRCNKDLRVISRTIAGKIAEHERFSRNNNMGSGSHLRKARLAFRAPVLRESDGPNDP